MNKPTIKPVSFPWNDDDMKALNECIETRWQPLADAPADKVIFDLNIYEFILDGELVPHCQLCTLDRKRNSEWVCLHCIIYQDSGQSQCSATPFSDTLTAKNGSPEQTETIQRELAYLKDLRNRMLASTPQPEPNAVTTANKIVLENIGRYEVTFTDPGKTLHMSKAAAEAYFGKDEWVEVLAGHLPHIVAIDLHEGEPE